MKIINEVGTSSIVFRLDKVAKLTAPSYIFETINQNSNERLLFSGEDISPAPLSYNQFDFVNGVSYSATQSRFDLDSGKYFLNVYQTQWNDLNVASASLLWHGEMIVDGEVLPQVISFTQSDDDLTIYFE